MQTLNKTIRLPQGSALIHCGKLKHSGAPITFGRRYLLVAFIEDSIAFHCLFRIEKPF